MTNANAPSSRWYVWRQFAYGLLLGNRGKPEEAQRIIRRALETDPNAKRGPSY